MLDAAVRDDIIERNNALGGVPWKNYLDLRYINEQLNGADKAPTHSETSALIIRDRNMQYSALEIDINR